MKNIMGLRKFFYEGKWKFRTSWILPALMLVVAPVLADDASNTSTNADLAKLANMDINQLMEVKVSILGSAQSVSQTPAAVSVVTQDDIQRSGARNIPEALRLVPGMDVAQVDASQWAVSARGFNDVFANKLLVMQDGRSLYTPLFSGVFWDVQDTMMEDIDRIEVVRGPGATVWGANAMNGVINIISKSAADTQGLLVSGGGGNFDRAFAEARYGGTLGSNTFYRVYGSYSDNGATQLPDGRSANDSWQSFRSGFRMDSTPSDDNLFTLQGDGYVENINQVFGVFNPASPTLTSSVQSMEHADGANILGRWTRTFSDTANFKLQAYYDYTGLDAAVIDEQRHTFDLDFRDEFVLGERNHLSWGLGYRLTTDTEKNNPTVSFSPISETLNLFSAFLQDEITLVPDRLTLTLGSKFEHNDYTGFEIEPGARLAWTPMVHQTFWGSVSRAVRTPSRAEETFNLVQSEQYAPGLYAPVSIAGTNSYDSEDLIAYEVGYRTEPFDKLSLDIAAYYNDYNHLRDEQSIDGNPTQFSVGNNIYGDTYGVEVAATWRVLDWWRLQPSYTLLKMDLHARPYAPGLADTASVAQIEGTSPENQFSIRSSMDLPHGLSFDTSLRYVDNLSYFAISSYFELDARLAWQINKHWEVAIVGQNLLHSGHAEFGPTYLGTQNGNITDIPRSVYAKVTWRF